MFIPDRYSDSLTLPSPQPASDLWTSTIFSTARGVRQALAEGARADERYHGKTPLMWAAGKGDVEILKILLAAGADPEAQDDVMGWKALDWARQHRHEKAVRLLEEAMPFTAGGTFFGIVADNDAEKARAFLDAWFWSGKKTGPGGRHLRAALQNGNVEMTRLLLAHGARPEGEVNARHAQMLRRAGLRDIAAAAPLRPEPTENPVLQDRYMVINNFYFQDLRVESLPWRCRVALKGFHAAGAPEAVIAGDCLSGLFNGSAEGAAREQKEADIFLTDRGWTWSRERKFLAVAFREVAGRGIMSSGPFSDRCAVLPSGAAHTWRVYVGPRHEADFYDIHFVRETDLAFPDPVGNPAPADGAVVAGGLLRLFDAALSQIACDGTRLSSTNAFKKDMREGTLTLLNRTGTPPARLEELKRAYPGRRLVRP